MSRSQKAVEDSAAGFRLHLPVEIDSSKAEAECTNGILRLTAPVVEKPLPTRIDISEG